MTLDIGECFPPLRSSLIWHRKYQIHNLLSQETGSLVIDGKEAGILSFFFFLILESKMHKDIYFVLKFIDPWGLGRLFLHCDKYFHMHTFHSSYEQIIWSYILILASHNPSRRHFVWRLKKYGAVFHVEMFCWLSHAFHIKASIGLPFLHTVAKSGRQYRGIFQQDLENCLFHPIFLAAGFVLRRKLHPKRQASNAKPFSSHAPLILNE